MRLIILAAGDSFELDGFCKLSTRHPVSRKAIIELYEEHFRVDRVTIIVGYKAMEIMNKYSQFDYVYNQKWSTTRNSFSLGMALTTEPCYVASSDYFISSDIVDLLDSNDNSALIEYSENRDIRSLNCTVDKDGFLQSVYPGECRNNDPELLGLFKICDAELLRAWKALCFKHGNLFVAQNLPLKGKAKIKAVVRTNQEFKEINTPMDYINFMEELR
jgi:choline kinase